MKKDFPGVTTAWVLMLTYSAFFVLLVISRNQQFWNQRKASAALVEIVPRANERQSVFFDLYKGNLSEQTALLKLSHSNDKNPGEIKRIILQLKSEDSLFARSEKLIAGTAEQNLFNKLKQVSSTKKQYLTTFLQEINDQSSDGLKRSFEEEINPVFSEFQQLNSQLLHSIKISDEKTIKDLELKIIHINNINIWISIGLIILVVSLGFNLIRIVKNAHSTTSALKESELRFRSFFNLAPIPMWVIDPETNKFISVNKAALEHYGYSKEEFSNLTIFDIRSGKDISKESEDVKRIKEETINLTDNKTGRFNSYHSKKDGEKIEVEIYTSPILINHKQCILTIVIDVTERNHFENKITKAIIKTQEDERYEIGSELHDNVCQILACAKMSLSMIRKSLDESVVEPYNQSRDAILLATQEIRNLSHRLAPAFFDNTKLEEAIESLLNTFNIEDKYNIYLNFDKSSKNIQIDKEIQLNLYRVLQEQLRNIIKHSNCSDIEVNVFVYNNLVHMRIADNGVGFELNNINKGIGLTNMKRRAELFSGKFYLNTSLGKGCEVLIIIPLAIPSTKF
jgi:PAS domain S-box-containing protein